MTDPDLLSQEEYAAQVGASPSWVSKATKQGKLIGGEYDPAADAVRAPNGSLRGYKSPTPVGPSVKDRGSQGRTRQNGSNGRGGAQSRSGLGSASTTSGHPTSAGGSTPTDAVRDGLEGAAAALCDAFASNEALRHTVLRLGSTAGGALLIWKLGNEDLWSALLGGATGLAITEHSLRQTAGEEPSLRLPQINDRGNGRLSRNSNQNAEPATIDAPLAPLYDSP